MIATAIWKTILRHGSMWFPLLLLTNVVMAFPVLANEHRIALVIGNDRYRYLRSLENSVSDASAIKELFAQFHFDVTYQKNLDRPAMLLALSEFDQRLSPGDVAVFYYAGHGAQYSDGVDYLLGTDAKLDADGHILGGLVLSKILTNIMQRTPRFALALIDACRLNPLVPRTRGLRGSPDDGLSSITPASGMMVVYSAGANQPAFDDLGPGDIHGLFVREFLKYASQYNEDIREVIRQVQLAVRTQALAHGFSQTPAVYNESVGNFYLASLGQQPPTVNSSPVPEIATSYDKGVVAYRAENFDEALRQFQAAAEQGNARAMTSIGYIYNAGLGTPRDRQEALRWYQKAAAAGNAAAFHNLGVFYERGIGVPKDYHEALRWYLKAVDGGNVSSLATVGGMYQLGVGVSQNYPEAFRWFVRSAHAGDILGMCRVSYFYANGMGVQRNLAEADIWRKKATEAMAQMDIPQRDKDLIRTNPNACRTMGMI